MWIRASEIQNSSTDEEYGDKPKKVRAPPREAKHKRSKNSQEDR